MSKDVLAWHFVGDALRDGRPIPVDGVTLKHKGKLELCASGLHASERLIDALQYAPGPILCRVKMGGTIKKESDQLVARQRTILWRVNSTDVLRKFARQCALDVAHLWNMPPVMKQYLETGDESLRDTASSAAWAAAKDVTKDAAWAAAKDVTKDAARDAARDAALAAVWADASAAAGDAASVAARVAARAAARDAQNTRLTEMVMALAPEGS